LNDDLRLKPRKGDLLAVALVVLLAVGLSVFLGLRARGVSHVGVEIYRDGTLVREVDLNADQQFDISGDYVNTAELPSLSPPVPALTASTAAGPMQPVRPSSVCPTGWRSVWWATPNPAASTPSQVKGVA